MKKLLALVLAIALLCSCTSFAAAARVKPVDKDDFVSIMDFYLTFYGEQAHLPMPRGYDHAFDYGPLAVEYDSDGDVSFIYTDATTENTALMFFAIMALEDCEATEVTAIIKKLTEGYASASSASSSADSAHADYKGNSYVFSIRDTSTGTPRFQASLR